MRTQINETNVKLWLSASDTYNWAHRLGACWPCSELSGKRLRAEFDSHGLVDFAVNGRTPDDGPSADEFNAITSDALRPVLPKDHPCYLVNVGQFFDDDGVTCD
ncbi:MAG: hypothetical protein GY832_11695 [Chloroflexi bacterium]|nr:hypothetical protein [Chloroflexota bacterium]